MTSDFHGRHLRPGMALTPREQSVYDLLVMRGELATSEVAYHLERSTALACKYLKRLHDKGKVRRRIVTDQHDIHTTWAMWSAA